jgi:hypothetical protein
MKKLMFVAHRVHENQIKLRQVDSSSDKEVVNASNDERDEEAFQQRKRFKKQTLERIVEKEWKIINSSSLRSKYWGNEYQTSNSCNLNRREVEKNEQEGFLYRRINGNEISKTPLTAFASIRKKSKSHELISQKIIGENATVLLQELENQRSKIPSNEEFPRKLRK